MAVVLEGEREALTPARWEKQTNKQTTTKTIDWP
jgi:hypothetical protein